MSRISHRRVLGAALAAPLALATPALAAGGAVSVTVNGAPVALNPAPITRAGRVFVPLRGIFERLGASVVYQSGTINATGSNGRTVALHIGETSATVNGQSQPLDVAPFVIGASTFVPLRFVGQALGAQVNYDGTNSIVAITTTGGTTAAASVPAANPAGSALQLTGESPGRGTNVTSNRPTIQTTFSQRVDANSLRVLLDGRDVTSASTISETGVVYAPSSPLQSTRHEVAISGKDASGMTFAKRWNFSTGSNGGNGNGNGFGGENRTPNFIQVRGLQDGSAVSGGSFTLRGRTVPNARVHVVAGSNRSLGNVFNFSTGSYTGDTTADANGDFSIDVALQSVSGGAIAVDVTSTDPTTKEAAEQKLRLSAQ